MSKYWYGCQVEKELKDICRDVLDILDKHLIPAAGTGESKVFYYKMYVLQQHTAMTFENFLKQEFLEIDAQLVISVINVKDPDEILLHCRWIFKIISCTYMCIYLFCFLCISDLLWEHHSPML